MKALVALLGLDSHWRGSVMVARVLREAGVEVVYLGNQFPEELVAAALQEDPRLIAISSFSGSHGTLVPELMRLLSARGGDHIPVIVGGAIPPADVPALRVAGVAEVFPPGRPLDELIALVRRLMDEERGSGETARHAPLRAGGDEQCPHPTEPCGGLTPGSGGRAPRAAEPARWPPSSRG